MSFNKVSDVQVLTIWNCIAKVVDTDHVLCDVAVDTYQLASDVKISIGGIAPDVLAKIKPGVAFVVVFNAVITEDDVKPTMTVMVLSEQININTTLNVTVST